MYNIYTYYYNLYNIRPIDVSLMYTHARMYACTHAHANANAHAHIYRSVCIDYEHTRVCVGTHALHPATPPPPPAPSTPHTPPNPHTRPTFALTITHV